MTKTLVLSLTASILEVIVGFMLSMAFVLALPENGVFPVLLTAASIGALAMICEMKSGCFSTTSGLLSIGIGVLIYVGLYGRAHDFTLYQGYFVTAFVLAVINVTFVVRNYHAHHDTIVIAPTTDT